MLGKPSTGTAAVQSATVTRSVVSTSISATGNLETAKSLADGTAAQKITFEVGNIYRPRFTPRSFNAIFAHQVLQHLRQPIEAIRQMRELLAPGGVLLASVPHDADSHHTVLFNDESDAVRLAKTAFDDVQVLRQEPGGRVVDFGRLGPPPVSYLLVCRGPSRPSP